MGAVNSPVGRDHALEAPFAAEHLGQQLIARRGVVAVDEVVGGHNSPRVGLAHTDLKASEIDLAKRPFRHSRIALKTVGFPVVAGEVLNGDGNLA